MAHQEKRRKALELRKQGMSYGQIKKELGVSKSTLSYWLRNHPLTKEQLQKLKDSNENRIESFRATMRNKRKQKLEKYYEEEERNILPLSDKELFIAGLFLYWGEGNKASRHTIGVYNTDPVMLQFALFWLTKCLKVPKKRIRVNLHLYSDMDIEQEIKFWCKKLKLNKQQFNKPYIKKSKRSELSYKGGFGHGTCAITVSDTVIKERFQMALKAILDSSLNIQKEVEKDQIESIFRGS